LEEHYRLLGKINSLFYLRDTYQRNLPRMLGARCRRLKILDVGAGDGSLGQQLETWASSRGWEWEVTNLDLQPTPTRLSTGRFVAGSVLDLPFPDDGFDVVTGSQMTHHLLEDSAIVRHFQEAWRVARHGIFINDLHRNIGLYSMLWLVLRVGNFPPTFRQDGLISVRRGFRIPEWTRLASQAGIPNARVRLYFGARVTLESSKGPP